VTTQDSINPYAAPEALVEDVSTTGAPALAHRGSRLAAAMLDGVIVGVPIWGIYYLIWSGSEGGVFGFISTHTLTAPLLMNVIGMLAQLLINGWMLHTRGQTLGKRMVGIRIVRSDGSRADFGRLFGLRLCVIYAVAALPFVGSWIAFADSLFIFGKARRCLHDRIADTKVILAS
jgi:uncharacterized RDD family membrane protein YckC